MAENKQLLGGLYIQDQYEVDGTPDSVSTICFNSINTKVYNLRLSCQFDYTEYRFPF